MSEIVCTICKSLNHVRTIMIVRKIYTGKFLGVKNVIEKKIVSIIEVILKLSRKRDRLRDMV